MSVAKTKKYFYSFGFYWISHQNYGNLFDFLRCTNRMTPGTILKGEQEIFLSRGWNATIRDCLVLHHCAFDFWSPFFPRFFVFQFLQLFIWIYSPLRWTDRPDCVLLVNGTFSRWDCLRCLGCVTRGPTNGTMSNVQ